MLVLSRHEGESIVINDNIVVTVRRIEGGRVTLATKAPDHIRIDRGEVHLKRLSERNGSQVEKQE